MAVGSILLAQGILLLVEVLLVQLDHQSPEMPQRLPQPNQLWQESSYGQLEKQGIGKHIKEEYKSLNRSSFKQKIKLDFLASY